MRELGRRFLLVVAAAIGIQYLTVLFYDPTLAGIGETVWLVLDFVILLALVFAVWFNWGRIRSNPFCLENRFGAYLTLVTGLLFLWNLIAWIWVPEVEPSLALWVIADVLLPVVFIDAVLPGRKTGNGG